MITGYTTGVFDLFHVGHLNILRSARALCDRLIVGVSTDELTFQYKKKHPIVPFAERIEIVRALSCVDAAIRRDVRDKYDEWRRLKFNVVFVGDDWYDCDDWRGWEDRLDVQGVSVVYLPNTPHTSTSSIVEKIRSAS